MKKIILPLLIVIILISIVLIYLNKAAQRQEQKIRELNEQIKSLKEEYIPLHFKIIQRTQDSVHVLVKFLDLDQKIVTTKKYALYGLNVSFDFYVVKFENGYIAFPKSIFTEKIAPENGVDLLELYSFKDFPQIFYSSTNSNKFNNSIRFLFQKIINKDIENLDIFGSMVQNTSADALNNRDLDEWFKIVCHKKGGLEIQKY